jgi:hypothetical protein
MVDLLAVYAHIMAAVFWVGHALFWTIVIGALPAADPPDGARLVALLNRSSWPPVGIPARVRIPFRQIGWAILIGLVVTGAVLLSLRAANAGRVGPAMGTKLAAVAALVALQLRWRHRPRPTLAYLIMALSLAVVAISVAAR